MKGEDYVTETNIYHAFLPCNTPIRKIGICFEQDSNPRPRSGQIPIFWMGVSKGKNARFVNCFCNNVRSFNLNFYFLDEAKG